MTVRMIPVMLLFIFFIVFFLNSEPIQNLLLKPYQKNLAGKTTLLKPHR